jgi:transketolase
LQSDRPTDEILGLGDLEAKFSAFGWHVAACDGHDHTALREVFADFRANTDRPKVLIANTVKGKGVSFMEDDNNWHYRVPTLEEVGAAKKELGLS